VVVKMKKIIILSLFLLTCFLPVEVAQAQGFYLETAQQIYEPGDTILITADLYNEWEVEIDVVLECLLTSQTNVAPDILISHTVSLGAGESKTVTLYEIYVTEDFPPDEYVVSVKLIEDNIIEEESDVTFLVEGTLKQMPFAVYLCKDEECEYESSVFIQGDSIYMDYESPIDSIQVAGIISYPDESEENITLPSVFQAVETGSYALLVTASKEGYKSETGEIYFAIIEEEPNIPIRKPPWVATFTVTDLHIAPTQVSVGETVIISAKVTNAGGAEGSYEVVINKNGATEATSEVTLAPGQSTTVSFSSTADSAGNYQIEIDGLTGEFTAIEEAPFNAWFIVGPILAVMLAGSVIYYFIIIRKRKGTSQTT
jgi:hypothetical protein